ncbi:lipase maturation factor family protein [Haloarcula sp. Atlit-120R]|uniref:lipase maturation factor family protein n=1 Tax=Haloarcula sp. Atlit-120R TaxID=2282135 RepID=UPI000EF1D948|nr:lipase maturation factor family protein [Haloarcula sp. Atlit-120R]RLM38985.1 lipase maturation factor family protein [Haloarcula sp. Atlit-120R]
MLPWEPAAYWLVRMLFHRALAVIYLLAFVVAATQFRPLAGEDGLLPIQQYVDRYEFRDRPSLFYVYPNGRVIGITAWAGVGLSALALVGVPSWLPRPYAVPVSILLWLLLWALFRNMFGAGLIKLRGDDCWRDLTALDYHYETQPIPNPVSWYAHHLPDRFHRLEVLGNHVVEVAVPFLYFAPQPWASVAGVATIGFQGWLMLTGNFSWLNALTIVQAIAAFRDDVFTATLPVTAPSATAPPLYLQALSVGLAAVVLWRSVGPVRNILSERQVMNTAFDSLRLVNAYSAFGSITRTRYEIVVQGTTDEVVTADTEWETYEFKGKPTDPAQRPRQLAPYHYRLDWQLWFAAMTSSPRRSPWFLALLDRLLAGDEGTEKLLASVPFSETTPTHVRAVRYRYRFTTPEERRETGQWWERERVGTYVSPISDGDLRLADV